MPKVITAAGFSCKILKCGTFIERTSIEWKLLSGGRLANGLTLHVEVETRIARSLQSVQNHYPPFICTLMSTDSHSHVLCSASPFQV